jgi:hypothetical protein
MPQKYRRSQELTFTKMLKAVPPWRTRYRDRMVGAGLPYNNPANATVKADPTRTFSQVETTVGEYAHPTWSGFGLEHQ